MFVLLFKYNIKSLQSSSFDINKIKGESSIRPKQPSGMHSLREDLTFYSLLESEQNVRHYL